MHLEAGGSVGHSVGGVEFIRPNLIRPGLERTKFEAARLCLVPPQVIHEIGIVDFDFRRPKDHARRIIAALERHRADYELISAGLGEASATNVNSLGRIELYFPLRCRLT